jgi:hypothetical protein
MKKLVFIAHPVSGDVDNNLLKIDKILAEIHSTEVIPVFPSHTWRRYLTDSAEDKEKAAVVNAAYFESGAIKELWVYGSHLTDGMKKEIGLAIKYRLPVIMKSEEMKKLLEEKGIEFFYK